MMKNKEDNLSTNYLKKFTSTWNLPQILSMVVQPKHMQADLMVFYFHRDRGKHIFQGRLIFLLSAKIKYEHVIILV